MVLFIVHKKKTGYKFVDTLPALLRTIAENKQHAEFALYAAMVFSHLILPSTKKRNNGPANKIIRRRLEMWSKGQVNEPFSERKALQLRQPKYSKNNQNEMRHFGRLMHQGKVSRAIRQLDPDHKRVLSLSQSIGSPIVLDVLKGNKLQAKPARTESPSQNPDSS